MARVGPGVLQGKGRCCCQSERKWVPGRENRQRHLLPRPSKLLPCRHLPSAHLRREARLTTASEVSAGHSSGQRGPAAPTPFPITSSTSQLPAVSPGFSLYSFALLHTSMSHQVPSTIDSASPPDLLLPTPFFLQDPGHLAHTSQNYGSCSLTALLPDPASSNSASISSTAHKCSVAPFCLKI